MNVKKLSPNSKFRFISRVYFWPGFFINYLSYSVLKTTKLHFFATIYIFFFRENTKLILVYLHNAMFHEVTYELHVYHTNHHRLLNLYIKKKNVDCLKKLELVLIFKAEFIIYLLDQAY